MRCDYCWAGRGAAHRHGGMRAHGHRLGPAADAASSVLSSDVESVGFGDSEDTCSRFLLSVNIVCPLVMCSLESVYFRNLNINLLWFDPGHFYQCRILGLVGSLVLGITKILVVEIELYQFLDDKITILAL